MREPMGKPGREKNTAVPGKAPAARVPMGAARLIGLQRSAGNTAVGALLGRAPAPLAVQRVAAQLGISDDGLTIKEVTIRGRPPSPYTGTMGDHATAYIVQVSGVRRAVEGKTLPEAVAAMRQLVAEARELPGVGRAPRLPRGGGAGQGDKYDAAKKAVLDRSSEFRRLDAARKTMEELATAAAASDATAETKAKSRAADADVAGREARSMTTLQDLMTAYLHFRELIPMTTLNVAAISPALAGKGKGESSPAKVLRRFAETGAGDPEELKAAVTQLVDLSGLALFDTENDKWVARRVAPALSLKDRVAPILLQHVQSIEMSYPGAVNAAWGDRVTALAALGEAVKPEIDKWRTKNIAMEQENLRKRYAELDKIAADEALRSRGEADTAARAEAGGLLFRQGEAAKRGVAKGEEKAVRDKAAEARAEAKKARAKERAETRAAGKDVAMEDESDAEAVLSDEEEEEDAVDTRQMSARLKAETDIARIKSRIVAGGGVPNPRPVQAVTASGRPQRKRKQDDVVAAEVAAAEAAKAAADAASAAISASAATVAVEDVGVGSHTATQLALDERGAIVEVNSEGRPPSQFGKGKMGAHTTAWVVHKDVIRTAILGRTVPAAIAGLPALGKGVDELAVRLTRFAKDPPLTGMEAAMAAIVGKAATVPAAVAPLLLQDAVNQLLTRVNVIPGVAFDAGDTGGDTEGGLRGQLLEYERTGAGATRRELEELLMGMLDRSSVVDKSARRTLLENHLALAEKAYPVSYLGSGIAGTSLDVLERRYPDKAEREAKRHKTN